MRYVTIPADAILEGIVDQKTGAAEMVYSFVRFVRRDLVNHEDVMKDDTSIGMMIEAADSVKDLGPGDTWALTDEQHEFVTKMARTFKFSPDVRVHFLPLVKALTGATNKNPAVNGAAKTEAQPIAAEA